MAKQMLFYETVVPVNQGRHAGWSVGPARQQFGFAARSNAVPVMSAEFLSAATEYPIVFGRGEAGFTPVVVLGIDQERSLFVDGEGRWTGSYVPAFVRRYPFVFARTEDATKLTLCLDEAYEGCDPQGQGGERLYDAAGEPTPFLKTAIDFARSFEVENRRTQEFVRMLEEHALLDPMQAGIAMPDGSRRSLGGFHAVSRERLKALSRDAVAGLFERDALELVYYHLASLKNLEKLRERAARPAA